MAPRLLVLGEVRIDDGGRPPSVLQRRLLAALVVAGGTGLTIEQARAAVWPEGAPPTARASLQNHVSRVRTRLGAQAVRWEDNAYLLSRDLGTDLDVVVEVHAGLVAGPDGDAVTRLAAIEAALRLVRGPAFADLDGPAARAARRSVDDRVAELRAARADALASLGRHAEAVAEHERLVADQPLHEGRQAALVDARARAGRRADAVAAYRTARRLIAAELGVEPGGLLDDAYHRAIADARRHDVHRDHRDIVVRRPEVLALLGRRLAAGPVVVVADEGAGATTLLATWVDERPGARVARLACDDGPWEPLRALEDLVQRLGAGGRAPDLRAGPARPSAVVEEVVARAVARGPVSVLVDDLHAAGPATVAAIRGLVGLSPDLRVAAVTRPEAADDIDLPGAHRWHLPPLDLGEVTDLVATRLRRRTGVAGLSRWLHAVTGGNPLQAGEVLAALQRDGRLRRGGDGQLRVPDEVPITERLRRLAATRLVAFDRRTRRGLDVLAVLDDVAGVDLLADLGVDPVVLAPAERTGLVVHEQEGWRFAHEVMHHAARATVPAGRAVEIARQAACHGERRGGPASRRAGGGRAG